MKQSGIVLCPQVPMNSSVAADNCGEAKKLYMWLNEEWVCIVKAFRLLVKITVTEKQKEYIDTVCKQAIKKDIGKKEGERETQRKKITEQFLGSLDVPRTKKEKSVTQEKNPCILSFKNSFNLKAPKSSNKRI